MPSSQTTTELPAIANLNPDWARCIRTQMGRVIKGKPEVVDQAIVTLLAGGHLLVEDRPGLGKTTLAYALARSIDCGFSRIQFTSDPSRVQARSIPTNFGGAPFTVAPGIASGFD